MASNGSRQGLSLACVLTLILGFCLAPCSAQYSGGAGTADDPYQIATAPDLIALGETPEDYDKHFILTADIDLDPNLPGGKVFDRAIITPVTGESNWLPSKPFFTGVLDGNGHTISHLTIKGTCFVGLFGSVGPGAKVSHLGLEAVMLRGAISYSCVGSLAGENRGSITACYSTGTITGGHSVGGLVGRNSGSIIASCSTATGTGYAGVGGLAGGNGGRIAASCSTGGSISGDWGVGGLVGANAGHITGSYSAGPVVGNRSVGGLVGNSDGGIVSSSFWDVETSGQSSSVGGVGLTTSGMQDVNTFLTAGWDLVDEVQNGTCDFWQISTGEYPQLRYVGGAKPVMPEGLGTVDQPYLIRDVRDLGTVWAEPMVHYSLDASVDLSGSTWLMAVIPEFGGTFDGQGHEIRSLRIRGSEYLGLFGVLEAEATVYSLGLDTVDVNGTGRCIGGLAAVSEGTITGCRSAGTVTGTGASETYIGGLVGENRGSISASRSTAAVTGDTDGGGLVGVNSGSIAASHAGGTVMGGSRLGGLVGTNRGLITTSYGTGAAAGDRRDVGGLVGFNSGSITTCYSTSPVTGHSNVGGFAGFNRGRISASYATGVVDGDSQTGGLVGEESFWGSGTVNQCFWDIQTTGCASSAGGIGKTTAEMQMAGTFLDAGWDFAGETANGTEDVWWIEEGKGYPRLWWETADQ